VTNSDNKDGQWRERQTKKKKDDELRILYREEQHAEARQCTEQIAAPCVTARKRGTLQKV
jgi:hypothetical protein